MYLLYLDESISCWLAWHSSSARYTSASNRRRSLALFERQIHHLNQRLERVQEKHFPNQQPIPFHASAIRAGRKFWRSVSEEKRQEVLDEVLP